MGAVRGSIPDELEIKFRRAVSLIYGTGKGNISKALKEAIEMWLDGKKSEISKVLEEMGLEVKSSKSIKVLDVSSKDTLKQLIGSFIGVVKSISGKVKVGDEEVYVIIDKGKIFIPIKEVSYDLSYEGMKKIHKDFNCSTSYTVIDDENYVVIEPKIESDDPDKLKKELVLWFRENFMKLLKVLCTNR